MSSHKSKFITAEELLKRGVKNIPMLVETLFPKSGLACLAGGSDTGKSSFLRQLAIQVCRGDKSFLGHKLNSEHKSAIFVATEDDSQALAFLVKKQYSSFCDSSSSNKLFFLNDIDNLHNDLDDMLTRQPCDLVILDAAADIINGNLNCSDVVRRALKPFNVLANKHNCLFLFLHHIGKSSSENLGNKKSLVGSQSFEAKMRSVVMLNKKEGLRKSISIAKGNYVEEKFKYKEQFLDFDENMIFKEAINGDSLVCSKEDLKAAVLSLKKSKPKITLRDMEIELNAGGFQIKKTKIGDILKESNK